MLIDTTLWFGEDTQLNQINLPVFFEGIRVAATRACEGVSLKQEKSDSNETLQYSIIKSLFLPDSTLQGTDFPIHIIWDRERPVNINIYSDDRSNR